MQNLKTKNGIIISILALVVFASMLIGTTLAWFTDSVSSDLNKIVSGTLDVGMNYWNSESGKYEDASNVPLFDNNALWEPGYMDIAYLEIENKGSLSFNYLFVVYPNEETPGYLKNGNSFWVSDYLVYAVVSYDVEADGEIESREKALELIAGADMGLSQEGKQIGTMHPDTESKKLALIVYMPTYVTSAEANHYLGSGKPSPKVKLSVDVYATQNTYEFDSFDDQYDAGLTPVWEVPIWRYAPDGGYTVDSENKKITVNTAEAMKYLGKLYEDMMTHPNYAPSEWEIVIGEDIDFGGEVLTEPIRVGGFKALDGNNKTITNVILNYILVDEELYAGLFDKLPSTKDLTLDKVTVNSTTGAAGVLAGGLIGDSYSNITINNSSASGVGYVGGLIGFGQFLLPIDFSGIKIFNTDLSLFGDGSGSAGGFAGYAGGSSVNISGSTVSGLDASGVENSGSTVGGLFGELDADAIISESTITEITIYRDVYIGAITGKIYSSRDVELIKNTVSVVVTQDGNKVITPLTGSGEITDSETDVNWSEVEEITGPLQAIYDGHFYEVFVTTYDITWLAAKESCENKNGHLVTITSQGENEAVVTIVNRFANSAWLGAYRPVCYGSYTGPHDFVWVTGEEWSYSNWESGEPNDSHPHEGKCENCLHMYGSGKWNDYQNNHSNMRGYVCEWESLQSYLNYLTDKESN